MNRNIIGKMTDAMKISKDDTVLVNYWSDGDETDLRLCEAVFAEKEISFKTLVFSDEFILKLTEDGAEKLDDAFFSPFNDCTMVIDIFEKPAGMPPRELKKEKLGDFGAVMRALFSFMSRNEKLIQITMPSRTNAALAGEDYEEYKAKVEKALDVDYKTLEAACREKAGSFTSGQLKIKTGDGYELTMDITGREWNIDAGEGAFPCGEVYIAPIEDRTEGKIFFKEFFLEDAGSFNDIVLTVKGGRVTDSNCRELNELLDAQDEGARIVGELGIGLNPEVRFCGKGASLDEDALGTFHIGLGMNFLFGGTNTTRFHMDFVNTGEIIG